MKLNADHTIDRFCVAGISYRKADFAVRSRYSLDEAARTKLLQEAKKQGLVSAVVVSTCNRTEIYGYAAHPHVLAALLVKYTHAGNLNEFLNVGFFLKGSEALDHMFEVASGLDSQIIGDYEISGQLKKAFALSRQLGMVGPIMDRTFNFVTQSSKKIKNSTQLSSGTISVSFAAIEWLQKELDKDAKEILVVGAGKFGTNVLKNLLHYLPSCRVTLCNRTIEKAEALAQTLDIQILPFGKLPVEAAKFDVILVCTDAADFVIPCCYLTPVKKRWLLDLSVPANIEMSAGQLPDTKLVNIDDISALLDSTISRRLAEVPKALEIIAEYKALFYEWLKHYEHAPVIRDMKNKLHHLSASNEKCEMAFSGLIPINGCQVESINTTLNNLMLNLKTRKEKGCHVITAYHDFLSLQNMPVYHD